MLGGAHRRVGAGDPPWQLRCPRHLSVGPAAHHRYADLEKEETQVLTGEPIPVVAALPRCRDLLLGLLDLRQGADRVTGLASRRKHRRRALAARNHSGATSPAATGPGAARRGRTRRHIHPPDQLAPRPKPGRRQRPPAIHHPQKGREDPPHRTKPDAPSHSCRAHPRSLSAPAHRDGAPAPPPCRTTASSDASPATRTPPSLSRLPARPRDQRVGPG